MSTRSITRVIDLDEHDGEQELLCLYRHCDGYLDGLGLDIYNILNGVEVIEAGCIAATLVAGLKKGPRDVYIYPIGTRPGDIEYEYLIFAKSGKPLWLKVQDGGENVLFTGQLDTFGNRLDGILEELQAQSYI